MGLFTKECAVCGRESLGINCAPLGEGRFLCAACDRIVRRYVKESTGRTFAPPARMFSLDTLRAIVAGETPSLELPAMTLSTMPSSPRAPWAPLPATTTARVSSSSVPSAMSQHGGP